MNKLPDLQPCQIRLARPTNQLEAIQRFYCQGLGFRELLSIPLDSAGYSGIILSVPDHPYHLEFCTHVDSFSNCAPPTRDNLLVFYLPVGTDLLLIENHMAGLGYFPVPATNPHWSIDGITFEDPDGWRVVLMKNSNV